MLIEQYCSLTSHKLPSIMSLARQNYHSEVEAAVNKQVRLYFDVSKLNPLIFQINIELYASYVYLSMSFYFDRDDVALPNIAKFFKEQSDEEREHATELMRVQNLRGGRVVLQDIQKPENDEWGTALKAFEAALALEKFNNESLLKLHSTAGNHNDAHLTDFIEEKYLDEQVRIILFFLI